MSSRAYGQLELNPGAQEAFVHNEHLYSAYIGGVGSGKTYAGFARALKYAMQTKPEGQFHGPRVTVAAATYPLLMDAVVPPAQEILALTGVADWDKSFKKQKKELHLPNGGTILFRSLDDPDTVMRGPELAGVFIDEGRNVSLYHWKLVTGRLRQKGYKRAAWVCSTPNGHDWMWSVFHPDSVDVWDDTDWFGAPTHENKHLPPEYVKALEDSWEGRFYEQEVLGRFVGVVEGGVFPYWDPETFVSPNLKYRTDLPLYTFWDFGYGDLGVCVFAQVEWKERSDASQKRGGAKVKVPWLYVLDVIAAKEWAAVDWARAWKSKLAESFDGARPLGNFGDPAGHQRNPSTGTSVISDLNSAGVPVTAAPKRPQDYAIRILNNMMAGERVWVRTPNADQVAQAFASHKWNVDRNGIRIGNTAVHDWTSHFVDAVRYGTAVVLGLYAREDESETPSELLTPDTYGHVFDQLLNPPAKKWLGPKRKAVRPTFEAPPIVPRS